MATLSLDVALKLLLKCEEQQVVYNQTSLRTSLQPGVVADIEAKAARAASSTASLSRVLYDARMLSDSLTTLHTAAESAVRNMRQIDTQKQRLQQILDKVDDLLDLRSCLSGAQAASAADDTEALAMHVRQFHAVQKNLDVPEADASFMREAEERLVSRALSRFDAAIGRMAGGDSEVGSTSGEAGVWENDVAQCCQTLAVLGRGSEALTRYVAYLRAALATDCLSQLRSFAGNGLEGTASAVNGLSALFSAAVGALDGPAAETGALLGPDSGPPALLLCVHSVIEANAARLVSSFTRSARMHAALRAREGLLQALTAGAAAGPASARTGSMALASEEEFVTQTSVLASTRRLAAIDNERNEAPLGVPGGEVRGTRVDGQDMAALPVLDAFLDESALLLQRCASYARLISSKARALTVSEPHGQTPSATSLETSLRSHHALTDAVGEAAGAYSALESACVRSRVHKAVCMDEPLRAGAWGAGIDLCDPALPVGPPAGPFAASTSPLQLSNPDRGADGHHLTVGGGGLCSTLVEDAGYVLRRAASRALATGNAESAASVLAGLAFALEQVILVELDARVKLSCIDGGAAESARAAAGLGLSSADADRIHGLRESVGAWAGSNVGSDRLHVYAKLGLPGSTPAGAGLLIGSAGPGANQGGTHSGAAGKALSSAGTGGPADANAPGARLTDDTVFLCLGLVNLQLAGEVAARLHSSLDTEALNVFSEPRELAKVRASLSGVADAAVALWRALDAGLSSALSRLTPRLRSALHLFEGTSSLVRYELDEESYEGLQGLERGGGQGGLHGGGYGGAWAQAGELGAQDGGGVGGASAVSSPNPFTTEFLPVLGAILSPYALCLTPSLAGALTIRVAGYIARQLEPRLKRKRYTPWGALQLDSDIRALVAFFVARSSRKARERFSRLISICALLNVDKPSDALDVCAWTLDGAGSGKGAPLGSRLSVSATSALPIGMALKDATLLAKDEVKDVLKLRVDFTPSEVDAVLGMGVGAGKT